jgi:hypothetical protein
MRRSKATSIGFGSGFKAMKMLSPQRETNTFAGET